MNDQLISDHILFRYLLGQLSEEEQGEVEERFLNDNEYYEQLLIVEDELRCAYAQGTLPPTERHLFEKRFLIFPDERQRVEMARAMLAELSSISVEEIPETVPAQPVESLWRQRLSAIWGLPNPAMRFAALAVAMLVLAAFVWLLIDSSRLRQQVSQLESAKVALEQERQHQLDEERSRLEQSNRQLEEERKHRARLEEEFALQREQPSAGEPQVRPAILSLLLTSSRIRGAGETKKLTIRQESAQVRLLLNVAEKSGYRSYQAVILNSDGATVWSRTGLRASPVQGSQFVVLKLSGRLLAEDDYEVNLRGLIETGEIARVGDYYFTVLKK